MTHLGPRRVAVASTVALAALGVLHAPSHAAGAELDGTGRQYLYSSAGAGTIDVRFGREGDTAVVGDWDGDGSDTLGVRRGAEVRLTDSIAGGDADHVFSFGRADDEVLVGDWDGDGKDTLALRRGRTIIVANTLGDGALTESFAFGRADDQVLVGDWDGDGKDTIAVRRDSTIITAEEMVAGTATESFSFGRADDRVVVGDWDGDGVDTVGVQRGATYILTNEPGAEGPRTQVERGRASDVGFGSDWAGDGRDTIALRRGPEGPVITQEDGVTRIDGVIVVNKTYALPEDYAPGMQEVASQAFEEMQADAAAAGHHLFIRTDYRDYAWQADLFASYVNTYGEEAAERFSARPGHSEHQTGLAIDINSLSQSFGATDAGRWVAQHAHEYGLIVRYPEGKESVTGYSYEPWHLRYVGTELATTLHESGDTLEEYFGITSQY
ncbi:D-alanyl-D-alanine carboxypeptidase family protein [Serinibacter salmoneus]|uniref:LAS superfamily LD-carboxypeptidase LdcB n=1 Tax=Serinibacter salmoneus TaxID=556530 RepID=A0A2A9D0Q0_9MICO|nr:D-alanyl-D-alanine carboxypeptidase family protein [Serinibacter salmoneus]PFG19835.1 LAS superfamily LD-carboxypeptidase LdcB [Serinibacter salmoneus]